MKRNIILGIFIFIAVLNLFSLEEKGTKSVLLVYEETNSFINPWLKFFEEEFTKEGLAFEKSSAAEIRKKDLSQYDFIIIYGAVMAFTTKEPIREWLNTETNLSGKKVGLFVTTNRWFLKKYFSQLEELLKKKEAIIVDAVSSATHNLKEDEKRLLIKNHILKMK